MNVKLPVCYVKEDARVRFGVLLHEVAKAWRASIDEKMRPLGLSGAQLTVICSLAINDRPLTQRELAEAMNVESPSLVRLLDRLETKGWVKREQSTRDRRMKFVLLTEKGLHYFDELVRVAQQLEVELTAGVDARQLQSAIVVLEQIYGRLCGNAACR